MQKDDIPKTELTETAMFAICNFQLRLKLPRKSVAVHSEHRHGSFAPAACRAIKAPSISSPDLARIQDDSV
jgi:hypothetical protein